ncbi:protein Aster-B-like isoform X2 [Cylas formicarius]|uniref:protein Aster-B-like isoform X2 n=1 Tax=Cylas formicarius TaxID=197179 RepID=UPI00295894A7|nr:protein Aster-B-like isoform X2 [Cylas formicarius]
MAWLNSFYPTYKSRSDEFKKLFTDLPVDERLVVDYSCALQKEILQQGRLYVTQKYLCFYANILGWETNLTLKWKDVTTITKEKTALVIPNAVLISTKTDKYFFASFVQRDKTYLILFRFWQNALIDKQLSPKEIWQWVHHCYGSELGLTSEDVDYIAPVQEDKLLVSGLCVESFFEAIVGPEKSTMDQITDEEKTEDVTNVIQQSSPVGSVLQTTTDHIDSSDTDGDQPIMMKDSDLNLKCTNSHEGKVLLDETLPIHVDQLFTLLFTSSKFYLDFHASKKTTDLTQTPWTHNPLDNSKSRVVNMTYTLGQTMGPKTSQVTERQSMLPCSKAGYLYSIDIESINAGIPYADSFYMQLHWCLRKVSDTQTSIAVYAQLIFKKNVWGIVKGMIERNVWSGVDDFFCSLKEALQTEGEENIPEKRRKSRRKRRMHTLPKFSLEDVRMNIPRKKLFHSNGVFSTDICTIIVFVVLLVLLVINVLLYTKLWNLEEAPSYRFSDFHALKNLPKSHDDLIKLLQRQESLHSVEAEKWQRILKTAVHLLRQAEESLNELQRSIQPSYINKDLNSAPEENYRETRTEL